MATHLTPHMNLFHIHAPIYMLSLIVYEFVVPVLSVLSSVIFIFHDPSILIAQKCRVFDESVWDHSLA